MSALLEAKSLSINFGGLKAVEGVDLSINEGEITSLIGPNGAGKTTFFNLITGFLKPTKGTVTFKEQDITYKDANQITKLGLVRTFQKTNIFAGVTVADSIKIGFSIHRHTNILDILLNNSRMKNEMKELEGKSKELLGFTNLYEWREHLIKNIPYGKQRMLSVALALATQPQLLMLDEPATGLNPVETKELIEIILKIRKERNITVFLIEHNMGLVVSISDRLAVLCNGEKLTEGAPKEVANDPRVIEAYLGRGYREHVS